MLKLSMMTATKIWYVDLVCLMSGECLF
jgi:hypothetical protein